MEDRKFMKKNDRQHVPDDRLCILFNQRVNLLPNNKDFGFLTGCTQARQQGGKTDKHSDPKEMPRNDEHQYEASATNKSEYTASFLGLLQKGLRGMKIGFQLLNTLQLPVGSSLVQPFLRYLCIGGDLSDLDLLKIGHYDRRSAISARYVAGGTVD